MKERRGEVSEGCRKERDIQKLIIKLKTTTPARLHLHHLHHHHTTTYFLNGLHTQNLTPVQNSGGGNCVFKSLAEVVFGDAWKYEFMRYMIVHRMRSFPEKYKCRADYLNNMMVDGKDASSLELQAIADITFSVVECYSTENFKTPTHTILPLRC